MNSIGKKTDRIDPRSAVGRDRLRRQRREQGPQTFWRSLSVIGMVGWPIALGSVGGVFAGRYLDLLFGAGIRFTLTLLMLGAGLGCLAAWKAVVNQ